MVWLQGHPGLTWGRRIGPMLAGLLILLVLASPAQADGAPSYQPTHVVSPQGPFITISQALAEAQPGDRIEVRGGVYAGPLVIDQPVTLYGIDNPVIDGNGEGSVVTITAPGVWLEGFVIRNSGDSLDREDAGVVVLQAPRAVITGNRIENALFGVYVKDAPATQVLKNKIFGKELALPRRGDAIRIWQSPHSVIANNTVRAGRDTILWFSDNSIVRQNDVRNGRYGLHLMYDNDIVIEENILADNHVGAFLMYSRRITLRGNRFQNNRGPSGYGVGLKDMDHVIGEDNLFIGNRIGLYLDNSPWSIDEYDWFEHNVFAYNDIGISFQPSVQRNTFTENTFLENMEQVAIRGGGTLKGNTWTVENRGNFWSDYAGYDANGDGLGDLPYEPRSLFENLMDQQPALRLFIMSPAQQAIELATRAFPILQPAPKLSDTAPLMTPVLPAITPLEAPSPWPMARLAGAMLLLVLVLFGGLFLDRGPSFGSRPAIPLQPTQTQTLEDKIMIEVTDLTKRFGRFTAVDHFNLRMVEGEAVALWGANGAGKTTIIKCILGLLQCKGEIKVNGFDLKQQGKAVRRSVGYVPQELAFYNDLSARDTVIFYARLKGVAQERVDAALAQVGLTPHAGKAVATLSGGMKQRLALAIALLADPPILILDEPTSNLDTHARDEFLSLLVTLKEQGKTLLFTSHRLEEVETLADRVVALEEGRQQVVCSPRELATRLGLHVTLKVYVPANALDAALATLTRQGFMVSRNGTGLRVQVAPNAKAAPIAALAQADIPVTNFELENGSWN